MRRKAALEQGSGGIKWEVGKWSSTKMDWLCTTTGPVKLRDYDMEMINEEALIPPVEPRRTPKNDPLDEFCF